ncbi:MAG: hypothetical protein A2Y00_10425 [Omnitrophica WOR_2 bacterium GWF2_43_52]|nr:MAG: hypothetical protein A2Y01_06515 [Omnitrophica WOR_2 bacterium GWC2_44_8]OGX21882.1 MAG: hypothetical protein A2Y00_10425 [Omnitrophica WOR_2 bacterium GWF2_43_52]OGX56988.1 MAG: hypothetical protein A2460_08220 [Omnitrophica WOR_2 bacterium RIFOXYC2_FULL_43_9]HAH20181.1 hypothetical protein [Candidatus Omnitrophota bacterium]HBG63039.1 hypothetical protein [Candidatus Omnitrophota bacterium]
MRVYKNEFERLKLVESFVKSRFPYFGVNKKQEITRLLYEISKRENIPPLRIIEKEGEGDYESLKKRLLKKRYPFASLQSEPLTPHLPKIELKPSFRRTLQNRKFYPRNIYIEKKAAGSFLARRLKTLFPKARFREIGLLKEYVRTHSPFGVKEYNRRQDTLFIVNENYDFFKNCPCTCQALNCGYHIFNLGFGCIYECDYCFLQGYANVPGIILTANMDKFFDEFKVYKRNGLRLGTGEFSDSLALDEVSGYSPALVDFFREQKGVTFEFKTKSVKIGNLLKVKASRNIVVSWSLNPQKIIAENEFFTPSLNERLEAAAECARAGYRVGFHFDPIIHFDGWEKEYALVIESLFAKIAPKDIAWISLGTFRFSPGLKQVIERRFPQNTILNEELLLGFDNKLRYPYALRYRIYEKMLSLLRHHSKELNVYLCMEEPRMWKELKVGRLELRCP